MKNSNLAGPAFVIIGVIFIVLGVTDASSRTRLFTGLVFLMVGGIMIVRNRRPPNA